MPLPIGLYMQLLKPHCYRDLLLVPSVLVLSVLVVPSVTVLSVLVPTFKRPSKCVIAVVFPFKPPVPMIAVVESTNICQPLLVVLDRDFRFRLILLL